MGNVDTTAGVTDSIAGAEEAPGVQQAEPHPVASSTGAAGVSPTKAKPSSLDSQRAKQLKRKKKRKNSVTMILPAGTPPSIRAAGQKGMLNYAKRKTALSTLIEDAAPLSPPKPPHPDVSEAALLAPLLASRRAALALALQLQLQLLRPVESSGKWSPFQLFEFTFEKINLALYSNLRVTRRRQNLGWDCFALLMPLATVTCSTYP